MKSIRKKYLDMPLNGELFFLSNYDDDGDDNVYLNRITVLHWVRF
jgi:hypothetical protein